MFTGFSEPGRVGTLLPLWLLLLGLMPGAAFAQYTPAPWPLMFIDYTDSTGNYIQDISDQTPTYTDIIYSATTPSSVAVACDGSTAFFRMQLQSNPYRNNGTWAPNAWVIAIGGPSGQGAPIGYVSVNASGNAVNVEVKDLSVTDVIYTYPKNSANPTTIRTIPAGSSGYFYLDFQVPSSAIYSRLGINATTHLRFFYGSSTAGGTINKDFMSGGDVSFLGLATTNFSGIEHGGLTPNPVELTAFTAHVKNGATQLRWRTATELNNFGFEVQRSSGGREWETIGFVPGYGTVFSPQSYDFEDAILPRGVALRYRLRQIDRDGTFEYSPIVEVQPDQRFTQGISGSFPTPATSLTTVNYVIESAGPTQLTLHDLSGRIVRTLSEQSLDSGSHSAMLDVRDLPRGMYMLRLQQPGSVHVHPLLVTE